MAFSAKATAVTAAASKTANQSSITGTAGAISAGDFVLLVVATDNNQTTDGDEGAVSSVTLTGLTWAKAKEFCNGQGSAQTGATISVWWAQAASAIGSGATLTVNLSNNTSRDATAFHCDKWTTGGGTVSVEGTPGTLATDGGVPGASLTQSGLTSGTAYLVVRAEAVEGPPPTYAYSANSTGWTSRGTSGVGTTGGASATNMLALYEYLQSSAITSATSNPTASGSGVDSASVIVAFKEVSSGTNVALTGQSSTGSAGTLGVTSTQALTGAAPAASAGTAIATLGTAITGQAATATGGTVGATVAPALVGSAATASAGTLSPVVTVALTGASATASAGTLTPASGSDTTVALTGAAATASAGTLIASPSLALTGQASSATPGTVAPVAARPITGQSATASQGSMTPAATTALAGQTSSAAAGTATPTTARALSGSAATSSAGAVSPVVSVAASGQSATAAAGTLTAQSSSTTTVQLSGLAATATAGTLAPVASVPVSGAAASTAAGSLTALGGDVAEHIEPDPFGMTGIRTSRARRVYTEAYLPISEEDELLTLLGVL